MVLGWIILATLFISAISLVGVFALFLKKGLMERLSFALIGLAAGALIGSAFLHLLPEALQEGVDVQVFIYALLGFIAFFLLERYLHWRHCHDGVCDVHAFTYLNLVGDGVHNFIDGLMIAASFLTNIKLGLITTFAIALHEIPQEMGDYGILIYGGFGRRKALLCNFLCGLTALLGAILGYFLSGISVGFAKLFLPLIAGGFIYIAGSDLIPELHKHADTQRGRFSLAAFFLGTALMCLFRIMWD